MIFMYHLRVEPLKVFWNSTNLLASKVPLDLQIASHKNQCCSTSLSPSSINYGYLPIEPPIWLAIVDPVVRINVNPNNLACDLPGDPNILLVIALPGCDWLSNCTRKKIAQEGSVKLSAYIEGTWGMGDLGLIPLALG
jgi:hypothetical protein